MLLFGVVWCLLLFGFDQSNSQWLFGVVWCCLVLRVSVSSSDNTDSNNNRKWHDHSGTYDDCNKDRDTSTDGNNKRKTKGSWTTATTTTAAMTTRTVIS